MTSSPHVKFAKKADKHKVSQHTFLIYSKDFDYFLEEPLSNFKNRPNCTYGQKKDLN